MRLIFELASAFAAFFLSFCVPNPRRIETCEIAYQECVSDATTKAEYLECRSEVDRLCQP